VECKQQPGQSWKIPEMRRPELFLQLWPDKENFIQQEATDKCFGSIFLIAQIKNAIIT